MNSYSAPPSQRNRPLIAGTCDPMFAAVKRAFETNLTDRDELGACVSVYHRGKPVVDLWGGYRDAAGTLPWQEHTLVCFMSTTKAIASLAVLSLVDRYQLNLDHPVAQYWPEFAQAGKADITVRCVLAQLAGLPVVDSAPAGSFFEPGVIEDGLAKQAPLWPPGTQPCYHSFTHGPLCDQIVRKVTGKSIGHYLRDELFGPLGIEFLIGLTDDEIARCAEIAVAQNVPTLVKVKDPNTLIHRAWRPLKNIENLFNCHQFLQTEFGSGNGHATARMVARIFSLLANPERGDSTDAHPPLLSATVLADATRQQWDAVEAITDRHFRYGTGFMLNNACFTTGPNPDSFGHPGLGGAIGFADPAIDLSFAYAGNRVHAIDNTGARASALIEAVYASL